MSAAPVHVESPSRVERDRNVGGASAQIWAGLSIVAMWLAVLAVGISGADFTTTSHSASGDTTGTTVPSALPSPSAR